MANTIVNTVEYPKKVQAFLRSSLVADKIAKAEFGNVGPKQQIVFPYMNDPRVQDYSYSAANTVDDTAFTTDGYTIDQVKTATANYDPVQNQLFQDPSWQNQMAKNMGYQLGRNVDQYVLQTGIDGAYQTYAGGTLSASNVMQMLAEVDAYLMEAEAMEGQKYIVMDPLRVALLPQMDAGQGFEAADRALVEGMNGYVGRTAVGLQVFSSNNLPYSVTLTMGTNPSDGETVTVAGVTFTFKNTCATAGDVKIGGSASTTQATFVTAVNGTGTGDGTDYTELSTDNRRTLQNRQVQLSAFASSVGTFTGYGRLNASTDVTSATVGTETFSMLAGVMGAIDLTVLREPTVEELSVSSVGAANHSKNLIATTLYGAGVFNRRSRGLVEVTANA